jgi:hypothetical protein
VARVLPIVVVLALLGCTAAAFAVTEGLKLEHSPISNTHVGKTEAPDSLADKTVPIAFLLRKPDRVTVELVNGSGQVVRRLVRSRREVRSIDAGQVVVTPIPRQNHVRAKADRRPDQLIDQFGRQVRHVDSADERPL